MSTPAPDETPPLQPSGLPIHTRSLTVAVRRQSESHWLARGDVIDLRKSGFVPSSYDLQPSGVIHMMSIELDFEPEALEIESLRVEQPFVAVERSAASGGECCRDPAPRLQALVGESLDAAFPKKLAKTFGGRLGCSHLLTLFQLMSSAVPRAVELERSRADREGTHHAIGDRFYRRSVFVDGFDRDPTSTDVVIQLADTHTRPLAAGDRVTERLALSHEVRTIASIDRKRFTIDRLDVCERRRNARTVGRAEWRDHGERIEPLQGVRLIPGMAGRVFGLLGDDPELAAVRDNLLQFAPGFLQITAAMMDAYFEAREREDDGSPTERPAVSSLGGNTDACYIWRSDGPIQRGWATGTVGESDAPS